MKILQLCKKFPYPLKDGESIAVTYLSKAFCDLGCEVTLLSMNTSKHYFDVSNVPNDFDHYKSMHTILIDNRLKWHKAFLNLFSKDSYHISRFISTDYEKKLIEILSQETFDVIQLETMYLTPYIDTIRKHSKAVISLRAHNIEFEIWERITSNTSSIPKKIYLNHLTKKLKKYELNNLNKYDYLVAISDRDLFKFKSLGYKNGAISTPIGINISEYGSVTSLKEVNKKSLCFIGAMDWMPNQEGLDWFLNEVWPKVREIHSDAELHIAGRNTPPEILNLNIKGLIVHGEIEDSKTFMLEHTAIIVPLFSGSGMRVKIIEGMALGKCIISTSIGMEGINVAHNHEILVADTAKEFLDIIDDIFSNSENSLKIGRDAQKYVSKMYDYKKVAKDLLVKYKQLIFSNKKSQLNTFF
jgi:glycosyltransferase involved in cell wall biosynthesis